MDRERAYTLTVSADFLKAAELESEANELVLESLVALLELKSSENAYKEENWKS